MKNDDIEKKFNISKEEMFKVLSIMREVLAKRGIIFEYSLD
jgi:hypothetical protein